jgi:Flp pilus assembly protein TadD
MGRKTNQRRSLEIAHRGSPWRRYAAWAVCGLLLLAIGLVFGQTIRHEFVNYDDNEYVYENPHIIHGLTAGDIGWVFTQCPSANWHPLTWLSHILDYRLYGLDAGGHHATNVLLHAATAILLFLVLRRMTGELWPSALVAAIFAIHPLRVESVAWIAERKDVLSGLFFMLTLLAYLGYARRPFSLVRYLTVIVLFALGLMAKPMLVTLPFALLLLDYWPLRRVALRTATPGRGLTTGNWHLVVEKIPFFALAAASCVATTLAQGRAFVAVEAMPFPVRISNALVSYVAYLGQFFYPVGLAVFYPHPGADVPLWKPIAAFFTLTAISVAALVWRRRCPAVLVGWFWYLGMLVPVIGLVQVGSQQMADRYTYLPQIGLCIALVWGAAQAVASWPSHRWLFGAGSALVLAILMSCAWRQTTYWRDSETLWNHALACTSRNALAHNNLGYELFNRGRLDEAIAEYRKTMEVMPNDVKSHSYLGRALADSGRFDEAIAQYRKALEIMPDYPEAHDNLGIALAGGGRFDEAVVEYQAALKAKPDFADAYNNLAWLRATSPQTSTRNGIEAVELAQRAVRLSDGRDPNFLATLAAAFAEAGRFAEAVTTARAALDLATRQNKQALVESIKVKIPLYEAGTPFRETQRPSAHRPEKP